MKITIDTHNCSREELEELKEYLDSNSWDFKTDEAVEINYTLGDDRINGVLIKEDEDDEFRITHRESFIEELMRWIGEARTESDKALMKADLEDLMGIDDEYILSSNSTNHYLYQGGSEFDETCKEMLEKFYQNN